MELLGWQPRKEAACSPHKMGFGELSAPANEVDRLQDLWSEVF